VACSTLPSEVLVVLLQFSLCTLRDVSNARLVCRAWRGAARGGALCCVPEVCLITPTTSDEDFARLATAYEGLRRVRVRSSFPWRINYNMDAVIRSVVALHSLQYLTLRGANINTDTLIPFEAPSQLISLTLLHCTQLPREPTGHLLMCKLPAFTVFVVRCPRYNVLSRLTMQDSRTTSRSSPS
jgi:hypothetical protein